MSLRTEFGERGFTPVLLLGTLFHPTFATLLTPVHSEDDSSLYFLIVLTTDYYTGTPGPVGGAPKFHVELELESDRTLPEERFQVLWQFCSTGVARVHGNEEADAGSEFDLLSNEVENLLLGLDGVLDALDLDGDD